MAPKTRKTGTKDSKSWLALGLLGAAAVVVMFALFSGKPDRSPQDPRSANAITQPDRNPQAPETPRPTPTR